MLADIEWSGGDPQQPEAYLLAKRPNMRAGMRSENRTPSHQDGVLPFLIPVLGCMRLLLLVATERS